MVSRSLPTVVAEHLPKVLAPILALTTDTPRGGDARDGGGHLEGHLDLDDARRALAVVVAVHRATACLEALAVAAHADLIDAIAADLRRTEAEHGRHPGPSALRSDARVLSTDEVVAATGLGVGAVQRRARLASAPAAVREPLVQAMATGICTLERATTLRDDTDRLPDEVASEVAERVLRPKRGFDPDDLSPDAVVSHRLFRQRLHAEVAKEEARLGLEAEARADHLSRRDVHARTTSHGTGELLATGTAEQAAAARDRLDAMARAAKTRGESRTLAQLRSDIAFGLLLHGTVPGCEELRPSTSASAPATTGVTWMPGTSQAGAPSAGPQPSGGAQHVLPGRLRLVGLDGCLVDPITGEVLGPFGPGVGGRRAGRAGDSDATGDGDATKCGQDETSPFADLPLHDPVHADPPPTPPEHPDPWLVATAALIASLPAPAARIDVRVNLTTLLGLQDDPAQLVGHGWLSADLAREIALRTDSVWHRVVHDPVTGTLLERTTHTYQPTDTMRADVQARDLTCRVPGCDRRSEQCDLDHSTPWPAGPTSPANLVPLCRHHHQLKTKQRWEHRLDADGVLRITTYLGQQLTSRAHEHHDESLQAARRARWQHLARAGWLIYPPLGRAS